MIHVKKSNVDSNHKSIFESSKKILNNDDISSLFWNNGIICSTSSNINFLRNNGLSVCESEHGEFGYIEPDLEYNLNRIKEHMPVSAKSRIFPMLCDFIPQTSWGSSLSNLLTKKYWDIIRFDSFRKSNYTCIFCGSRDRLECHEKWEYFPPVKGNIGIQKLVNLMPLCSLCHETQHLGLANIRDRLHIAAERIRLLNRFTDSEMEIYFNCLNERFDFHNNFIWALDLSSVSEFEIVLSGKWTINKRGSIEAETKTGLSKTALIGVGWKRLKTGDMQPKIISKNTYSVSL